MNTKQLIYALSFFGMASFFAASCGNKTEEKPPVETTDNAKKASGFSANVEYTTETKSKEKDVIEAAALDKAVYVLVKERLRILSVCAGSYCSGANNYCGNDTCLAKIVKCHIITDSVFNVLTSNGSNGYAVFTGANVGILLRADCKKYIKLTCSATSFSIDTVSVIDTTLANTAHYTVALWQQIAKKPVKTIEIHKAIYDASTNRYLIPFKVNFTDNSVQVYDVSNDYP